MTTGFTAVERVCREIGVEFDPWEVGVNTALLGKRADGLYAGAIAALAICRQAGKTFDISRVIFALCIIHPGLTVVWTAHRTKVAKKTFEELVKFAREPKLAGHIDQRPGKGIKTGQGDRSITFRNDSVIDFAARERAVRGYAKVDVIVLDEGQILTEAALADMIPTANQAPNPLVLIMFTPPRRPKKGETDKGQVVKRIRREALSGLSNRLLYVEFGAERGDDTEDPAVRAKSNPSYPYRTTDEAYALNRSLLTWDDYLRECFCIFDEEDDAREPPAINLETWARLRDRSVPAPSVAVLTIDVSPDRTWASVGVAADAGADRVLVMDEHRAGLGWIVPYVDHLYGRHKILELALHPASQAGALVADLRAAGWAPRKPNERGKRLVLLTNAQVGQATATFLEGIGREPPRWVHVGQIELDAAVDNATTRTAGEVEVWDHRDWAVDISPLRACSIAASRWIDRPRRRKPKIIYASSSTS